jgi:2',3'-cyclic-nucleotide 2'-phosphodiesterase (5'-nucleotidase family)
LWDLCSIPYVAGVNPHAICRARELLLRVSLCAAALLSSASCLPLLDGTEYDLLGQQVRLTVLHTSDIHSRLLPYDYAPIKTDIDLGIVPEAGPFGGATRIAAVLRRERQRADRVLHLDSGDSFQGAPIFNVNFGEVEFKFLSLIGLDAAVVGNHEFDAGPVNFAEKARDHATFPLLAANYIWEDPRETDSHQAALYTAPYTVKNLKGLKVGVIGMANVSSLNSLVEGDNSLQATPFEQNEALRAYVELLRPLVDLVVVTSHLGLTEDQDLITGYEAFYEYQYARPFIERAADRSPWQILEWFGAEGAPTSVVRVFIPGVSGVDAIFGGHLHVVLNPPQTLTDPSGRRVLLAHSGAFAKYVGRLDMVVQMPAVRDAMEAPEGAELISHDYRVFQMDGLWCDDAMRAHYHNNFWDPGQFRPLPAVQEAMTRCALAEDLRTTELLQGYVTDLDFAVSLTQIFAYAPKDIARRNSSTGGDAPLGNMAAESMRTRRRVEAEVALTNTLGIRDNLYAGPLSHESMFNVFPFENTINVMYLSGREMQELFDFVATRSAERGCQSQAQISGARFTMDCAQAQLNLLRIPCPATDDTSTCPTEDREGRAAWQCLEESDTGERRCWAHPAVDIQINGNAIDPNATYKIAVNDYIARGGSGFSVLKRNTSRQETHIPLRDSLIGYMQNFCSCAEIDRGFKEIDGRRVPCGVRVNGEYVVEDQIKEFCRQTRAYQAELWRPANPADRGALPEGCGCDDVAEGRAESCGGAITAAMSQACGCSCVDVLENRGAACGGAVTDAMRADCAMTHYGPYLGRCNCFRAMSGDPVCGFVTQQARTFCKNPTRMPVAIGLEDGRIGRRIK